MSNYNDNYNDGYHPDDFDQEDDGYEDGHDDYRSGEEDDHCGAQDVYGDGFDGYDEEVEQQQEFEDDYDEEQVDDGDDRNVLEEDPRHLDDRYADGGSSYQGNDPDSGDRHQQHGDTIQEQDETYDDEQGDVVQGETYDERFGCGNGYDVQNQDGNSPDQGLDEERYSQGGDDDQGRGYQEYETDDTVGVYNNYNEDVQYSPSRDQQDGIDEAYYQGQQDEEGEVEEYHRQGEVYDVGEGIKSYTVGVDAEYGGGDTINHDYDEDYSNTLYRPPRVRAQMRRDREASMRRSRQQRGRGPNAEERKHE